MASLDVIVMTRLHLCLARKKKKNENKCNLEAQDLKTVLISVVILLVIIMQLMSSTREIGCIEDKEEQGNFPSYFRIDYLSQRKCPSLEQDGCGSGL